MDRDDAAPELALLLAEVAGYLARHGLSRLCEGGERVVVGCSGGADSLSLLVALRRLGVAAHAVYVDHGLRTGTEAEAAFVAEQAARLGATCSAVTVEVSRRGNLLAAAREARYAALVGVVRRLGSSHVAVGHTATDQAETIAFRRLRGDLPHALAGMPELRPLAEGVSLLRPLLAVTRAQTHAAVASLALVAVADPSNEQARFTRIRLRRELLAAGPAARDALLTLAAEEAAQLAADEAAAAALGPPSVLDAAAVAAAGPGVALRLLRRAGLHRAGLRHARNLLALAASSDGTQSIDLGSGLVAERRYGQLYVGPVRDEQRAEARDFSWPFAMPFSSPSLIALPFGEVEARLIIAGEGAGDEPDSDLLDRERLPPSLVLRNAKPGDRVLLRAGHRKLSDLFIDRKLPRPLRRRLPLLVASDGGEVLWIAGLGPSEAVRARPDTRCTLRLRYRAFPSLEAPRTTSLNAGEKAAETRRRGG